MRVTRFSALLSALLVAACAPSLCFAAAQKAAGALSAKPTAAVGTSLYSIQLSFDPDVADEHTYNLDSFRLTVQYDYTKVFVDNSNISFIAPYSQVPLNMDDHGDPVPSSSGVDFSDPGFIKNIAGLAPLGLTQSGDVYIFSINFFLFDGVNRDTDILDFKIFAGTGDFLHGTDPSDGATASSSGDFVAPARVIGTYNQLAAQVAGDVPLPSVFPAGVLGIGMLALSRRRPSARPLPV